VLLKDAVFYTIVHILYLSITMYTRDYDEKWPEYFEKFDRALKERIAKKIKKILESPQKRHMHKISFFVVEMGQYRLAYRIFEENRKVRFYFVGTHKEYEKWYKQLI